MNRIGRYGTAFGPVVWFQTRMPTRVFRVWWFWFFIEARPTDTDKKEKFPLGTLMEYEGRKYYYYKMEKAAYSYTQVGGENDRSYYIGTRG